MQVEADDPQDPPDRPVDMLIQTQHPSSKRPVLGVSFTWRIQYLSMASCLSSPGMAVDPAAAGRSELARQPVRSSRIFHSDRLLEPRDEDDHKYSRFKILDVPTPNSRQTTCHFAVLEIYSPDSSSNPHKLGAPADRSGFLQKDWSIRARP